MNLPVAKENCVFVRTCGTTQPRAAICSPGGQLAFGMLRLRSIWIILLLWQKILAVSHWNLFHFNIPAHMNVMQTAASLVHVDHTSHTPARSNTDGICSLAIRRKTTAFSHKCSQNNVGKKAHVHFTNISPIHRDVCYHRCSMEGVCVLTGHISQTCDLIYTSM